MRTQFEYDLLTNDRLKDDIVADWSTFIFSGFQYHLLSDLLFASISLCSANRFEWRWPKDKESFWQYCFDGTITKLRDFIGEYATITNSYDEHNPAWHDRLDDLVFGPLFTAMVEICDQVEDHVSHEIEVYEQDYLERAITAQLARWRANTKQWVTLEKEAQVRRTLLTHDEARIYRGSCQVTQDFRHRLAQRLRVFRPKTLQHTLFSLQQTDHTTWLFDNQPAYPTPLGVRLNQQPSTQRTHRRTKRRVKTKPELRRTHDQPST